ncbi:MAG: PAS domain-containing protein [Prolixibacteraceae bacterium]|nr:PAS domain-containing protein [Prolixibacteraceae bacterium]
MRNYKLYTNKLRPSLINGQDALFRAVFDGSPDAIFLLHPDDFHIVDCNTKALKLFQADDKNELSGCDIFSLYESEPVEFSKNSLIENINIGREHSQELPLKSLKGNIFWGSFSARRVETAGGALIISRVRRVVDYMKTAEMLSAMIKQTSKATGYKYFSVLTELLCKSFGVSMAMVARIDKAGNRAVSLNCWNKGQNIENLSFDLEVSVSQNVMRGYTTFYPSNLAEMFPDDKLIRQYNTVGYLGTPVFCAAGEVCGLLILMDDKPMEEIPNSRYVLSIFASRAGAELERIQVEESYQQKIRELEGR